MKKLLISVLLLAALAGCASVTGRTVGEIVDDSAITSAINLEIIKSPELKYLKINVDSFRGYVTLTGVVPSKNAELKLLEIARGVRGVKGVKSNLMIEK